MKRKILNILLVGTIIIEITGCKDSSDLNYTNSSNTSDNSIYENLSTPDNEIYIQNSKYGLGETFTFDGLELTFDTTYSFVTVQNRFSDYNGKSVIKLGVNVRNISSEKNHLNMFHFDLFGSQGQELDGVSAYFDESIDYGGDLKSGASYKKYFYILYDGDGIYNIDFDNYSQEASVEFSISK